MNYIEDAEQLLLNKGFILAEVDKCRQDICKKLEDSGWRKMFIQNGGTAAEWANVKVTFRTKPRRSNKILSATFYAVSRTDIDKEPLKIHNTWGDSETYVQLEKEYFDLRKLRAKGEPIAVIVDNRKPAKEVLEAFDRLLKNVAWQTVRDGVNRVQQQYINKDK
jgi:hypothetical protein